MTRIKICGITNRQDAQMSADAGADALGFIGVPGTARYVIPEVYGEISEIVPLFVKRVVVVHRPEDADEYLAEYVQHYADTTDKSRFRRGAQWRIRAFRMRDAQTLQELADYPDAVGAVLLDAYHKEHLGGSGETFDWDLAAQAKRLTERPILLAGGLTPENVQDALEAVRPYGVDVSSGVEDRPGVKDHAKVQAFIRAVREWDLQQTRL
jgi:phosphoribosylanthranilate isomerase